MKAIYDEDGKVYAKGSVKQLNKIYDKIVQAYPKRKIYLGDVEDRTKCVGSDRSVSFMRK